MWQITIELASISQIIWEFWKAYLPAWVFPTRLNDLVDSYYAFFISGSLSSVGVMLQAHFDHTGDLTAIEEAVIAHRRAVQLTPDSHAGHPAQLSRLGNSLQARFDSTGDLADIAEAISTHRLAVQLTPKDGEYLPAWLNNVGNSLQSRFRRTGDLVDIGESISASQRAVRLAPQGSTHLGVWLNNLGNSLQSRFEHTGDLADIDAAITEGQRAIQLTREDHEHLPVFLGNLGNSLQFRFNRTGNPADLTEAILAKQRAIQLTPAGHARLPALHFSLGESLYLRSLENSSSEDLDASLSHFQSAATSHFGAPQDRLNASKQWARILYLHNPLSPDVLTAFDTAIHLLVQVAGLRQTVKGRYTPLQDAAEIAQEGGTTAFLLQRPDKAVEWLEQGRCVAWSQLNNLRTPLDELQACNSQLSQRLTDVLKRLERAASTRDMLNLSMNMAAHLWIRDDLTLASRWDNVLLTVRGIPGFKHFLRPSTCPTLMRRLPQLGAVIITNVSIDRCDAIALLSGQVEPVHIPLTNFSLEKANKYRDNLSIRFQAMGNQMHQEKNDMEDRRGLDNLAVNDILLALWNEVVKPILDTLAYPVSPAYIALS